MIKFAIIQYFSFYSYFLSLTSKYCSQTRDHASQIYRHAYIYIPVCSNFYVFGQATRWEF